MYTSVFLWFCTLYFVGGCVCVNFGKREYVAVCVLREMKGTTERVVMGL